MVSLSQKQIVKELPITQLLPLELALVSFQTIDVSENSAGLEYYTKVETS